MSWIKIDSTLTDKPEVHKLSRMLKLDRWAVAGRLVALWGWCDTHTEDGRTMLSLDDVDEMCGKRGFADALVKVGWLSVDAEGEVSIVDFSEHNGATAKKRAQNARDAANCRERKSGKSQKKVRCETLQEPDLEKEKEYNNMGVGKATLHSATLAEVCSAEPAPTQESQEGQAGGTSDGYAAWLAALCQAHPSARRSRTLAVDVDAAARNAFERCPEAAAQAPLLAAYLADTLRQTRYGENFYRPTGQRKFFDDLEDVIAWAEKWDKETKWSKRKTKPAQNAQQKSVGASSAALNGGGGQVCHPEDAVPLEEAQAMIDEMKRELQQEEVPQEVKLYPEAVAFVLSEGVAQTSALQRKFYINYMVADKLVKRMQQEGIITNDRERKVVER